MFLNSKRLLFAATTTAILVTWASAVAQERRTRVITVTPSMSIRSQIQPNDEIVLLTRQSHGAVADPNRTFREDIEDSVRDSKSGAILLIEVTGVKGRMTDDGNWLASDVKADVIETMWNPSKIRTKPDVQFHDPTGGEIVIGSATVKTDDVLFYPGRRYILFLRTLDERVTPSRYPLLVQKEQVFNNFDLTHKKRNPDPAHGRSLKEVVAAIRKAAESR